MKYLPVTQDPQETTATFMNPDVQLLGYKKRIEFQRGKIWYKLSPNIKIKQKFQPLLQKILD